MTAVDTALRTCFISAPATVDTSPLQRELGSRGVRSLDVRSGLPAGTSVLDTVRSGIAEADFVCGVIPAGPISANVLFELGLAVGRDLPALAFVDPRVAVPSDLQGIAYARATLDDTEAVRFHLDTFLGHAQPGFVRPHVIISNRKAFSLAPSGREWLDRAWHELSSTPEPPREVDIVQFLKELFERSGAITSGAPRLPTSAHRADLAVWIDDLQSLAGNPLLIEVVGRPERVAKTEARFRDLLAESGALLGVLVYLSDGHGDGRTALVPEAWPMVVRVRLDELVEQVKEGSFVRSLLDHRNRTAHAVSMP